MAKLANRAKVFVASAPGTGPATLGAAVAAHQTFADAGVANGDVVSYVIEDGAGWEVGRGTYSSTGPTLTRTTIIASSAAGAAIGASSGAVIFIANLAEDIPAPATSSDIAPGSNATRFLTAQALLASVSPLTLTDASTIAWNMANGIVARVTLGGNRTLGAPTNAIAGVTYLITIQQDASGSRTLSYASCWNFGAAGVPTLSTGVYYTDVITAYCLIGGGSPLFLCSISKGY